jgi:two-component system phosphate regulon response regulator PhoB
MANTRTVVVVEDEADVADSLRFHLERRGYVCHCIKDGASALATIARTPPDLVILDRLLPGLSGDELTNRIRRDPKTATTLVVMLTSKAEESDQLVGFALGADDYVTKPFSIDILMARIDALLGRASSARLRSSDVRTAGPITLDAGRREVRVHNDPVVLTSTEFSILWALAGAQGRVLTRAQLIQRALGSCAVVAERTIDVHIAALRKKLRPVSGMIQTVRGAGYALRTESVEEKCASGPTGACS